MSDDMMQRNKFGRGGPIFRATRRPDSGPPRPGRRNNHEIDRWTPVLPTPPPTCPISRRSGRPPPGPGDAEIARLIRAGARAVGNALRWFVTTVAEWRERQAAYERLRLMSDRELADIGLTRDQIARVFAPEAAAERCPRPRVVEAAPAPADRPAAANDAAPAPARAA